MSQKRDGHDPLTIICRVQHIGELPQAPERWCGGPLLAQGPTAIPESAQVTDTASGLPLTFAESEEGCTHNLDPSAPPKPPLSRHVQPPKQVKYSWTTSRTLVSAAHGPAPNNLHLCGLQSFLDTSERPIDLFGPGLLALYVQYSGRLNDGPDTTCHPLPFVDGKQ